MKSKSFLLKSVYPVFGFLLLTSIFSACKKDTPAQKTGAYEMSFKVNGSLVDYKTQESLIAAFSQTGSQYLLLISGYDANSNMSLQIYDDKQIGEMSYSGYDVSGSALVGVLMGYQDTSGTLYTQLSLSSDMVINISSITTDAVSGTFSGTLQSTGKADISITEGKFTVWRAN